MNELGLINWHMMFDFFTPSFARKTAKVCIPIFGLAAPILLAYGLYAALIDSPPDYQQGESVRIMYIHVPAAWMSLMIYGTMALFSLGYLVWRNPLNDVFARESASIGLVFTSITLITGMLWGKPIWGTWWAWDARLTSMLILWFLYMGYILAANSIESTERRAQVCALIALIGSINLPIIKFSVEWWNTLHQPASVIRSGGIAIDPSMQVPLFTLYGAFVAIYGLLLLLRVIIALNSRRFLRKKALQNQGI